MKAFFKEFYKKSLEEKWQFLKDKGLLPQEDTLKHLPEDVANQMIENYLLNYEIPLGVAVNFEINEKDYIVPMVVEEPSVIAAACNGAKKLGPISASVSKRELIGQIVFAELETPEEKITLINQHKEELLEIVKTISPSMVKRGGGPTRLWAEVKGDDLHQYLIVYLGLNTVDAMGANVMNSVLEALAPRISEIVDHAELFSILSNYSETAITTATARIPILTLNEDALEAEKIARRFELASHFAHIDEYRAATHNKGIFNGIDPVAIATGNDWRAIEAGGHTYAARSGKYQSLTNWKIDSLTNELVGTIALPLQVATVGGTISVHPTAQWALKLLGSPTAQELSCIIAAVGLAQNFAAVFALVTDGIQKGHMSMQARSLAMQVGASIEEVPLVVEQLKEEKIMNSNVATTILNQIREKN